VLIENAIAMAERIEGAKRAANARAEDDAACIGERESSWWQRD